jgi:hypothetical protein
MYAFDGWALDAGTGPYWPSPFPPDDTACKYCGISYFRTFWHVPLESHSSYWRYARYLVQLHILIDGEYGEGPDADALRDKLMDLYKLLTWQEVQDAEALAQRMKATSSL